MTKKIRISNVLFLAVAIVGVVLVSGCVGQEAGGNQTTTTSAAEMWVRIDSYDCKIVNPQTRTEPGTYQFRAIGTASGPVNTELTLMTWAHSWLVEGQWIDDPYGGEFDCGGWTRRTGTYNVICDRKQGDPEETTWMATSIPLDIRNIDEVNERYSASVYNYYVRDEQGVPQPISVEKRGVDCTTEDFSKFIP